MLLENFEGVWIFLKLILLGFTVWLLLVFGEPRSWKIIRKTIPGPPKLPFFGNSLELLVPNYELVGVFTRWANAYGKRIFLAFGRKPRVLLIDRYDVQKVLGSIVHIEKSEDYKFLVPWLGLGLITISAENWPQRRKLITPAFHTKILEGFVPVFNRHAATLVQILDERINVDTFDVFPLITSCTLDIISETAMGLTLNIQENPGSEYENAVYRIRELMLYRTLRPYLFPDLIWSLTPQGRQERISLKILHEFNKQVVQQRKKDLLQKKLDETNNEDLKKEVKYPSKRGEKRLAFLDLLLETQAQEIAEEKSSPLSDRDIYDEVATFMSAGHDPTTANICWSIFLLASYPQIQAKVQEEIDTIFKDDRARAVTVEDLSRLKYLECCISEALRIYPSVPVFGRKVIKPLELDENTTLPPGTGVLIIPYLLHHDADVFPDPENFIPERFSSENSNGRHPYAYVPFAAGPRNCIGKKFAMMEEKVILCHIFRKFNVTAMEKRENIKLCPELTLRPRDGIIIKLSCRN